MGILQRLILSNNFMNNGIKFSESIKIGRIELNSNANRQLFTGEL